MLSGLSPARRRLMLSLLTTAALAVLVVAAIVVTNGLRHSGSGTALATPPASEQPGPVLLIPGYGGSTTGLDTLAARLRSAGKQTDVVSLPGGGTGDLTAQARVVQSEATALLRRTGAPSLDVIGYSAGGIVARIWLSRFGGAAQARRVITLGTPHHGTELASLGSLFGSACPVACQQLEPTSTLLASLNASPAASGAIVSLWSTADDVVVPASSSDLDGAALNLTVQSVCATSAVRHTDLPVDPTVTGIIEAELQRGAPVPLTPADCTRVSS